MDAVSFEVALRLVSTAAVTRASVEAIDGMSWAIVLRGRADFILKSERQNPRRFARVETALGELRKMGLRTADVDFRKWTPEQDNLKKGKLPVQ